VAGRAALTTELILEWADRHKERTGGYPHAKSGPVEGTPGEAWHPIDSALSSTGAVFRSADVAAPKARPPL
jgi:hypothetical protein